VDNLTHSLIGVALGRAGLDRLTPRATWILLLAANAPDIDVVSGFGGSLNYLHYHRNITHSLVALPVLPVLVLLAVRAVSRKPLKWRGAYLIALIGVASHLALDLTNTYGVRLLLPFSARWLRLDLNFIFDFWIWGVLLLAIFAPLLAGLVNAEIGSGAQPRGGARRGFAIFALAFIGLYDGGRYVAHTRAVAMLDSRIYSGAAPERVAALPGPASVFRWRGLAETSDTFTIQEVDVLGDFDPTGGRVYYKPESTPPLEAARSTEVFQEFLRFSQFPFWQSMPAGQVENATRVEALDLRFGDPQSPGFVATAIVDEHQRVLEASFSFGGPPQR
jgi:inner membrane protein